MLSAWVTEACKSSGPSEFAFKERERERERETQKIEVNKKVQNFLHSKRLKNYINQQGPES